MPKFLTGKRSINKKITFSVKAPDAKNVILMGDFNSWNSKKHPMEKTADGLWKKTVMLSPGKYEYKFCIDGKWETDPLNDQTVRNHFGSLNNVLKL